MKRTHSLPVALALTATLGLGLAHADVETTPQFGNGSNTTQNQGQNQGTGNGYYQPPVYYPYSPPAPASSRFTPHRSSSTKACTC